MSKLESFPRPTVTYHSQTYDRISQHHGFNGAGKTILVIGGSSGVGHSICKAFAQANVARIAIISRSLGPQAQAKSELEAAYPSTEILIYQASITDSIRMTNILQELGTVDVLVLCAAVVHRQVKATEVGATKAYLETPLPAGGMKTIINITSAAAQTRSPFRVGYGPSKAAITQVMQHFAWERESEAVRVFSFHPGVFYTPSVAENYAEHARVWEDINLPAHFAVWLAGPESGFLNERYVWANWDVNELIMLKDRLSKDRSFLTIHWFGGIGGWKEFSAFLNVCAFARILFNSRYLCTVYLAK